jgi:glutamyl-tRNA reductase
VDVDFLSQNIQGTLENRKKEVPKAENIILEMTKDFEEWEQKRKMAPHINQFKGALQNIENRELHNIHKKFRYAKIEDMELSNKMIQKITNRFAKYILDNPEKAEEISELMQDILVIHPNIEFHEKH